MLMSNILHESTTVINNSQLLTVRFYCVMCESEHVGGKMCPQCGEHIFSTEFHLIRKYLSDYSGSHQ